MIIPWLAPTARRPSSSFEHRHHRAARASQELQRQARADSLTGIANRRSFYENGEPIARSRCAGAVALSLITIDIDSSRRSTHYPHPMGATALCRSLSPAARTRHVTTACWRRTGGEEFQPAVATI